MDVLDLGVQGDALVREAHVLREGGVGFPSAGLAGGDLLQHLVGLLEGEPLHLWDEEVGECDGEAAEGAPEEEDFGAEVGVACVGADEVGGDDGDDLV